MYLLIDDLRDTPCDIIARTPDAAYVILEAMADSLECIIFDHDLGDGVATGYDIMKDAIANNWLPNEVQLVTSNPVGRINMQNALKDAGYSSKNGLIWNRG